ncbi:MAG: DUF2189 domain-containing protein [Proteobacteria bacterium]|nr:DUF2189 domain-containing protein [Pseudomonadota bacterium]
MAQEVLFSDLQISSNDIRIRKIGLNDLRQSLIEGYHDFNAKPSFGLFLIVMYSLFALLFTRIILGENLLYLAFPVVAGLTLIGPVVSVVLFEMSRRREQGLDLRWQSAFNFVHTSSFAPIVLLSIVMMLLYVAWVYMAQFLYFGVFGEVPPESMSVFLTDMLTTREGVGFALYGTALGFLFAFTALAISVVAFPLLLDKPASSFTAVSASVRAVTTNPLTMAVWALVVVALLAVGAALFLIGLAAILPILGHSTWHLYRRLVED